MAYDLEEQEQIASLKAFWNKFGNLITWALIVVLGGIAAYNFWNARERSQAGEASALFDQLAPAIAAKDAAKVQRIVSDVESKYKDSTYAQMSAMAAAKFAFDSEDLKGAKAHLNWVIANGNAEYKSIAKVRLAGVLMDEKAYDEALKQLDASILPEFAGIAADRKGDILVAQNKIPEARAAYEAALKAMDDKTPGRGLVQFKLESIGGTVAAPKAAA
ncbi:tetratricopeptide repeat protein [Massilia sp. CF038]|jgi:predicted negative regulator of RcsB-dependent stress response|uniref:YfgM family protein n=1 Tax=Massilia sp. CF038 TaxID=1881045 RepID=UPI0009191BB6|nr:tetratricopeptide repeat protein [Massilia sp. CF038]SHG53694.1 Putative negative regulator of RcsB-dependent stress response [Massilia sp. CF038]